MRPSLLRSRVLVEFFLLFANNPAWIMLAEHVCRYTQVALSWPANRPSETLAFHLFIQHLVPIHFHIICELWLLSHTILVTRALGSVGIRPLRVSPSYPLHKTPGAVQTLPLLKSDFASFRKHILLGTRSLGTRMLGLQCN
jgi:hypothetical protein